MVRWPAAMTAIHACTNQFLFHWQRRAPNPSARCFLVSHPLLAQDQVLDTEHRLATCARLATQHPPSGVDRRCITKSGYGLQCKNIKTAGLGEFKIAPSFETGDTVSDIHEAIYICEDTARPKQLTSAIGRSTPRNNSA